MISNQKFKSSKRLLESQTRLWDWEVNQQLKFGSAMTIKRSNLTVSRSIKPTSWRSGVGCEEVLTGMLTA